jgi:hypothetical protein
MAYKLVTHYSVDEFNKEVNELLESGWQLYGFPLVTSTASIDPEDGYEKLFNRYFQALVCENQSENSNYDDDTDPNPFW